MSGFSLAVFLFSLMIYVYATPHLETMQTTYQLNETVYDITHSGVYSSGLSLLSSVEGGVGFIPVFGESASGIVKGIKELMTGARDLSESVKRTLELLLFLTAISFYAMIVSFITFVIGTAIALRPEQINVIPNTTKIIYCSECGTQNESNSKHCSQCGKGL